MGLKKLQTQAAEARKEVETTIGAFVKEARGINNMLLQYEKRIEEITKAYEDMGNLVMKAGAAAKSLNTHGIVQLDSMKRLLIVAAQNGRQPHPVNLAEIEKLEYIARDEIEKNLNLALKARMEKNLEKLVAGWPNKIEVGMIFKKGQIMLEIAGPELKATNINLKGNAARYHKVKLIKDNNYTDGGSYNLEELSPQKGWKFLKT